MSETNKIIGSIISTPVLYMGEATAKSEDVRKDKTFISKGGLVSGTMPNLVAKSDENSGGMSISGSDIALSGNPSFNGSTATWYGSSNVKLDGTPDEGGFLSNAVGSSITRTMNATHSLGIGGTTVEVGEASLTPTINKSTNMSGLVDASSGAATTTKPASGIYVGVKSASGEAAVGGTLLDVTAGYIESSHISSTITDGKATLNESADTYVPVKAGAISVKSSDYLSTPIITVDNATGKVTASVAGKLVKAIDSFTSGYITTEPASTIKLNSSSKSIDLSTQPGKIFDITTENQAVIGSGKFTTGIQWVPGVSFDGNTDTLKANILKGTTIKVKANSKDTGLSISGTMVNNGAIKLSIAKGVTYTIPEGYHNGQGTVTADGDLTPLESLIYFPTTTYHLIISAGDYHAKAQYMAGISIKNALTISKYIKYGEKVEVLAYSNDENRPVVSIDGTMKPASASLAGDLKADIKSLDIAYNEESEKFIATKSAIIRKEMHPESTVINTGYADEDMIIGVTNLTGTAEVNAEIPVGKTFAKVDRGCTVKPKINRLEIEVSGVTDAAAGSATTEEPTSGVYVKVKSDYIKDTALALAHIAQTGYVDKDHDDLSKSYTAFYYGADESKDTYIPIKLGEVTVSSSIESSPINMKASIEEDEGHNRYLVVNASTEQVSREVTPNLTRLGYITSPTKGSVTIPSKNQLYSIDAHQGGTFGLKDVEQTLVKQHLYLEHDVTVRGISKANTTLDAAGNLVVKDTGGNTAMETSFPDLSYNRGESIGYGKGLAKYEPTNHQVTDNGYIYIKNKSDELIYEGKFERNYNAGEKAGIEYAMQGTAKAEHVRAGYTFTNSSKIGETGTMPDASLVAGTGYVSMQAAEGIVDIGDTNIIISEPSTTKPTSGYYFRADGSGKVKASGYGEVTSTPGYISTKTQESNHSNYESKISNVQSQYYTIPSATLASGDGHITLTAGSGSVSIDDTNVVITKQSSKPSSGYYFRANGSGSVTGKGWGDVTTEGGYHQKDSAASYVATDSKSSNTASSYYSIPSATLASLDGHVSLTAGSGSVSLSENSVALSEVTSKPSSGYYFKISGSGTVSGKGWGDVTVSGDGGYLKGGDKGTSNVATSSKSSSTASKYYQLTTTEATGTVGDGVAHYVTASNGVLLTKVTIPASYTVQLYNASYSTGYSQGSNDYYPRSASLAKDGTMTVGTNIGSSYTFLNSSNSYNTGYNTGASAARVGTATVSDVLSGKTFTNSSGSGKIGTMTNRGAGGKTGLLCDDEYKIDAGYYNGNGVVKAASLEDQTLPYDETSSIISSMVVSGYSGWAEGKLVIGSMINRGAVKASIKPGKSYTIPKGYHNGSGTVTASNDNFIFSTITTTDALHTFPYVTSSGNIATGAFCTAVYTVPTGLTVDYVAYCSKILKTTSTSMSQTSLSGVLRLGSSPSLCISHCGRSTTSSSTTYAYYFYDGTYVYFPSYASGQTIYYLIVGHY